ncbi:MAG: hypothetical protein PHX20_04175 [Candidatus Omnitrophica bacterium]|nr:hypothetical protein [Candidatus Omnitrophota bacterium]
MSILFYTLSLAGLVFLTHLAIWRIRPPKKQTAALLKIFLFTLVAGTSLLFIFPGIVRWDILPGRNPFEIVQFFLLFLSIAAAYIVSYPAIEVDSPTLLIINAVFEAGPQGLEKGRLEGMMSDEVLVIPRIKDMLSDNMVYLDGERYRLMPKGLAMARIFSAYRNMIRGVKGG